MASGAEIAELEVTLGVDQNVFNLDVAVDQRLGEVVELRHS